MDKLNRYILNNISLMFFSIFMPLFVIASIIFLIRLASITAIVQVDAYEMFLLYLFILPELIYYTLPISFFIGAVIALSKLSFDYELTVLFTLGIKPQKLLGIVAKISFLTTVVALLFSIILIPHAKQIYRNFMKEKKSSATFNVKASEFGQKFGDWMLYLGSDNNGKNYTDVVLFNKAQKRENFIIAQQANITNEEGKLRLQLRNGKTFNNKDNTFTQVDYEIMNINDKTNAKLNEYLNTYEYWTKGVNKNYRERTLTSYILISLFPILSIFIILSIGIINTRYQRSFTYLYIFLAVGIYYGITFGLAKKLFFVTIAVLVPLWLLGGYFIYKKSVLKKY